VRTVLGLGIGCSGFGAINSYLIHRKMGSVAVAVWLVARTRQTRKAEDDGEGELYGLGLGIGQVRRLRGTRLPGRRMRWQPPWRDGEGGRYGEEEMEGGRWA
jgi:hypothetical protein